MANKQVIDIEVNAQGAIQGIRQVGTELDKVDDKAKDVKKETGGAFSFLETVSPRAASAIKSVSGGVSGLIGGFKALRVALISTGIGAIVVALGSMFVFLTKTKRGAELLERATSILGATISTITDRVSAFGETLFNAFSNPKKAVSDLWEAIKTNFVNRLKGVVENAKAFGRILQGVFDLDWDEITEGAKDFGRSLIQISTGLDRQQQDGIIDGFREMGQEIVKNANAADKLTQANQRLRDSQRALNVETARARADIKELNKIAEDTTKSYDERIAAAQKAGEMEQALMNRRLALAAENVRIIREQNALSESTAEDLDRLADAEIELANIRMESNELQTTLQNKNNTLVDQRENERLANDKAREEERLRIFTEMQEVREALVVDAREKELMEFDKKTAELFQKANDDAELLNQLEETRLAQRNAIRKKFDDEDAEAQRIINEKKLADEKALQEGKWNLAQATTDAIISLAELVAGDDERRARKAFAISKALNLASAAANTYRAVTAALAESYPTPGARFVAAATAGVIGLSNVAKIAATKFGGGGASGGGIGGAAGAISQAPSATAVPTLPINIGQSNQQAPIPAYVIGSQVQDDMEARARVNDLARL